MKSIATQSCLGQPFSQALLPRPRAPQEVKAGDLVITQAWSRATPGGAKIGGGYLTIENKGTAPDRLIGGSATSPARSRSTRWP